MTQTVVGIFDTPDAAHTAEQTLVRRGIDQSALHLAAQDSAYAGSRVSRSTEHHGGITGGIRNFFSELFGTDHSDEVDHYSEAVRRGGVLLAVDVPDGADVDEVRQALLNAGAVDIDERVEYWRKQGWTGYNPEAQPYTADQVAQERAVLPVIKEELEIGKREVGKGTVRVFSRTVETPVRETVNLREEHATIERRPADRPVTQADLESLGDKTLEIEERAEKAVVNKTARVVEEVVVGKEVTQRSETIEDTVRHTEVEIDRGGAATQSQLRPYEDYEPDYRQDFQTRYASQGGAYDDYAPAYRYGHSMASDARYQGRDWDSIEPMARQDWERQYPESTWDRAKMAVRHGWERVSGRR